LFGSVTSHVGATVSGRFGSGVGSVPEANRPDLFSFRHFFFASSFNS
jgi:hypothetical protein